MTEQLNSEQRQSLYDDEQSKIGKFSGLLSASCKFAWAGSLAIFFRLLFRLIMLHLLDFKVLIRFCAWRHSLVRFALLQKFYSIFLHTSSRVDIQNGWKLQKW
jgi:hypothetical protein